MIVGDKLLRLHQQVLHMVHAARKPLGAGALAAALEQEGVHVSSATAGRLLGELEEQGYLVQVSNKGRVLSEQGKVFLEDLEEQEHLQSLAFQLLQEIRRGNTEEMIGVLVARRAMEREICRLAAIYATERETEEILTFAEILEQGEGFSERHAAVMDHKFHEALALASRNSVLLAALRLIHRGPSFWRPLANVRNDERYSIRGDHLAIAQAVANRDPDGAERALLEHLDKIIDAVRNMEREKMQLKRDARFLFLKKEFSFML